MTLQANASAPARAGRTVHFPGIAAVAALLAALSFPAVGADRQAPPRLEAIKLDGSPYSLAETRGAVTVLVVWSPDSLASRKSIGELQRFAALFRPRGVHVLAISTTGDAERLRRFADERGLDLPIALLGETNLGPFPEPELPRVYVFDRQGEQRAARRGMFRLSNLEQLVFGLL